MGRQIILKRCSKCKLNKPLDCFGQYEATAGGTYWQSQCTDCRGKMAYRRDPEKNLEYKLQEKYNLSMGQYEELLREQGGVCAICNKVSSDGRRLSVDHSHNTGKVRALLCPSCNTILGMAKDSIEILTAAIAHLRQHGMEG